MPLFQIQDSDRPAFVVAATYAEALEKWQLAIAIENDDPGPGEVPQGINHICDDDELILKKGFAG